MHRWTAGRWRRGPGCPSRRTDRRAGRPRDPATPNSGRASAVISCGGGPRWQVRQNHARPACDRQDASGRAQRRARPATPVGARRTPLTRARADLYSGIYSGRQGAAVVCLSPPPRNHPMQPRILRFLLFMACEGCAGGAGSAPAYPDRPIKLIVHTTPGSGSDAAARLVAQEMGRRLGQQIVVDNRAGAGGAIGVREVDKATADGHTLLAGASSVMVMLPAVSRRKLPYDADADFAPIGRISASPFLLVVGGHSGI